MARGKVCGKEIRKLKGKSAKKKIDTVHKMLETEQFVQSMIKGDLATAEQALSKRMQQIIRQKYIGEGVIELEIEDEDGYEAEGEYDGEDAEDVEAELDDLEGEGEYEDELEGDIEDEYEDELEGEDEYEDELEGEVEDELPPEEEL